MPEEMVTDKKLRVQEAVNSIESPNSQNFKREIQVTENSIKEERKA